MPESCGLQYRYVLGDTKVTMADGSELNIFDCPGYRQAFAEIARHLAQYSSLCVNAILLAGCRVSAGASEEDIRKVAEEDIERYKAQLTERVNSVTRHCIMVLDHC